MKVLVILTLNATFYLATLDPPVELKCRSISTISQQLRGLKNSARKDEFINLNIFISKLSSSTPMSDKDRISPYNTNTMSIR